MQISVVIPNRNDPVLWRTIDNVIQKSATKPEIIVVHDGRLPAVPQSRMGEKHFAPLHETRGPQACRDIGIMYATGEIIFATDSHMDFEQGWDTKLLRNMQQFPNRLACLICHHGEEMSLDATPYYGAESHWHAVDHNGNHMVLDGKWRTTDKSGPIGCVMGACYAFHKDWYCDTLDRPWRAGRGWGHDEEKLSIPTWLMGGEVVLLPIHIAHQARRQGQVGYTMNTRESASVWYQRWHTLQMLPMGDEYRAELEGYLMQNPVYRAHYKAFEAWGGDDARRLREIYAGGPMSFEEYRAKWIKGVEIVKKETRAELAKRAKARGVKNTSRMKRAELEDVLRKMDRPAKLEAPPMPDAPKPKTKRQTAARANYGAEESNRTCHHCGSAASRITNTRKTGIIVLRYRDCCDCGGKRTTREVVAK